MTAGGVGVRILHAVAPGRLRLSLVGLRGNHAFAAQLARLAQAETAWLRAEFRSATGSAILHHDPAAPHHGILERLNELIERAREQIETPPGVGAEARPDVVRQPSDPRAAHAQAQGAHPWHSWTPDDVQSILGSDPQTGLSAAEADARLRAEGPNLLPRDQRRSRLSMFREQFESLPVLMLSGSAVVSIATGGIVDAVATLAVVATNAVLGYVTEGQAESVIHALTERGGEAAPATVVRDGARITIPASEMVRGDLYVVRAGTQVMADARLVAAERLMVDESALTGETLPVEKAVEGMVDAGAPIGSRPSMLHAGTIVTEGSGSALVVATGSHTTAARIALLSQRASRPRAPVEEELDRLGARLVRASLAACGLLLGIGVVRGYAVSVILRDALALAVAAVPEGLPVVATTTMALGLKRMEKRGILIRRIDAVESLGALQVICLDKTGTLTQNRMEVVAAAAGLAEAPLDDHDALRAIAEAATLNNDATILNGGIDGSSATEAALLEFARACGLDVAALRAESPRLSVIERAPRRPWMATHHDGPARRTVVKGAPDAVLGRCTHLRDAGRRRPLTADDRTVIAALNDRLAARPARVLAFAETSAAPSGDEVADLTWLGLVAMVDPLRPGARAFVAALHRAGIDTVMITGDQAATAGAIARELDLAQGGPIRIIDSTMLSSMDPALLAGLAPKIHVFARVSADQKLAIVQALQATGRVVGMTGDGVNDAPALKAANIGIAMGESGTDLARDVANVVISDDELTTLIDAIAQGRAVYRNIRRALEFLVTTNMSEIAVSLVEALHGPGELETPMELLWINLVTDVLPGLGLALADADPDAMARPPRARDEAIIPAADMRRMALDSGMIAVSSLTAHFIGLARYGPGPQTRGMTFLSLSLGQLLYTMTCQRSDVRKLRVDRLFENRALDSAVLASIFLALLPFVSPALGRLLGVARLRPGDAAIALAAAAIPAASVLARRGIVLELEAPEARTCETS